jgi:GTP-binding protein
MFCSEVIEELVEKLKMSKQKTSNGRDQVVVAIDGPSGSGKSSTAKLIAKRAKWEYLDTGALYRALTFAVLQANSNLDKNNIDSEFAKNFLQHFDISDIRFSTDPEDAKTYLAKKNISTEIRSDSVTTLVSFIARVPEFRAALQDLQRTLIEQCKYGIVVEGRDIGTVIAPDADLKIYLDADLTARGERRILENSNTGLASNVDNVAANLVERDEIDSTRNVSPLMISEDAIVIDSTHLDLNEVVEEIWDLLEKRFLIGLPTVVVLGRPNVGKSTLVNRLLGRREAIVEDTPGVTRDRVRYEAEWNGKRFYVVDTGGWSTILDDEFGEDIVSAAAGAIDEADLVLLVVDSQVGAMDDDQALLDFIRSQGKEILLVANKVDSQNDELQAHALWNVGAGEPYMISAQHGRGAGEMLDLIVKNLPEVGRFRENPELHRIALVGRPNVGKSSLLNALAGENRVIVSDVAGTTRDPVDEIVQIGSRDWKLIDTAGLRKKSHTASGSDYYASLRTARAIERCEVAVVLFDGSVPITEQDLRILSMAEEAGRAVVLVINKWDLVDEDRRMELERELDRQLVQFPWVERVNLSAYTGWHRDRLSPALQRALVNWSKRIPTSSLNSFLGSIVAATPPPVRGGKQPKIKFATQATICPPKFVLFTTEFIEDGYRRFLERRLREQFDFNGTPVSVVAKIREKRGE